MVLGIKKTLFLGILLSLFLSCKSSSLESNKNAEAFVTGYLSDRYKTEFNLIDIQKANAPGEDFNTYEARFTSTTYDRRSFLVSFTGNDKYKINKDQFPIILLEYAFLQNLDIEIYKDFPVIVEVMGEFVEDKFLNGINSLDDAIAQLKSIQGSSWEFFIYTAVDKPFERETEVEDMVINLLRESYAVLPAETSATAYIFKSESLTEDELTPDMEKDIVDRNPAESSMYEEWLMGWTPSKLESLDNSFQSVVKNRDVIPY